MTREMPAIRERHEVRVPGDMRGPHARAVRPARPMRRGRPMGGFARSVAAVLGGAARLLGGLGRLCLRRPLEALGGFGAAGAAAYVCVNALGFQAGQHPAPILPGTRSVAPEPAAVRREAARPVMVAPVLVEAPRAPESPSPPSPRAGPASRPPQPDRIGDMIRADETTTASVTPRSAPRVTEAAEAARQSLVQTQRALTRLGYGPLEDDGRMGPSTRSAIERFERDRKLPVTGMVTGRTLQELTGRAGPTRG